MKNSMSISMKTIQSRARHLAGHSASQLTAPTLGPTSSGLLFPLLQAYYSLQPHLLGALFNV
jgi:hypothetical protein